MSLQYEIDESQFGTMTVHLLKSILAENKIDVPKNSTRMDMVKLFRTHLGVEKVSVTLTIKGHRHVKVNNEVCDTLNGVETEAEQDLNKTTAELKDLVFSLQETLENFQAKIEEQYEIIDIKDRKEVSYLDRIEELTRLLRQSQLTNASSGSAKHKAGSTIWCSKRSQ